MQLEQQVCSLELSKRLKQLGVKQESLFGWVHNNYGKYVLAYKPRDANWGDDLGTFVSAFTVAELGEMLPREFKIDNQIYELRSRKNAIGWDIGYAEWPKPKDTRLDVSWLEFIQDNTEADARAKTLIYLIENDLLKPS